MTDLNRASGSRVTQLDTQMIVSDPTTRYFLIKSYSHDNIGRSLTHGVWATSQRNEKVFAAAYHSAAYVVLFFSVNHSSRFSGFGVITSAPGESHCDGKPIFCGPDGTPFPGKMFNVHWITCCDVFFRDCEHLSNSFNENKSVKVGRDGQEIDPEAGRALAELIDSNQPDLSRPAPLMLTLETQKQQSSTHTENKVPANATIRQLAAVAKFLKKSDAVIDSAAAPPPPLSGGHHHSRVEERLLSERKTSPELGWNFDWLVKQISEDTIRCLFPIDLTELETYEEYLELVDSSRKQCKLIEEKYNTFPAIPYEAAIGLGAKFDAELFVNLIARSASQDEIDNYVSQVVTLYAPHYPPPQQTLSGATLPDDSPLDNSGGFSDFTSCAANEPSYTTDILLPLAATNYGQMLDDVTARDIPQSPNQSVFRDSSRGKSSRSLDNSTNDNVAYNVRHSRSHHHLRILEEDAPQNCNYSKPKERRPPSIQVKRNYSEYTHKLRQRDEGHRVEETRNPIRRRRRRRSSSDAPNKRQALSKPASRFRR